MVRELVHHGYRVRACIRDANSWRGADCVDYLGKLPNVEVIDGCDLFTAGSYDRAFKGAAAVFHVAAVLGNSADGKSQPLGTGDIARDVYEGGLIGTKNVIDSVNKSGSVARLLYTSSMAAVSGAKGAALPQGYEWTEEDWSSDDVEDLEWGKPHNSYSKSKVDTERFINQCAAESGGQWDAVSMNPAMICGPILFKAQVGQWIEQIGRVAGGFEPAWPSKYDMYYNIIDVRDLVKAHRLAAESEVDHVSSLGGSRYIMHGSGGRSALRLGTEIAELIEDHFPSFVLGEPATVTDKGKLVKVESRHVNDSKKARSVLGATFRSSGETVRDLIESFLELGVMTPRLKEAS